MESCGTYGGKEEDLGLVVVGGSGPGLLGRDWLSRLRLDWREIHKLQAISSMLDALLAKHEKLFRNKLVLIRGVTAKLHISSSEKPHFPYPHSIPYFLRSRAD